MSFVAFLMLLMFLLCPILASAELVEQCSDVIPPEAEERLWGPIETLEIRLEKTSSRPYTGANKGVSEVFYKARYDRNGAMLEETLFNNGLVGYKNVYAYDSTGFLLSQHRYGFDGKLMGRSVFEYDQAERGVTSRNYVFGEFRTLLRYEYDEHERVISKTYSDINGRVTSNTVYTFDPRGNLIEKKETRLSGHSVVLRCAHDARDRLISSVEQRALDSEVLTTSQRFDYVDDKVVQTSCRSHDLSECWKSTVLTYAENGAQETINYRRNGSAISKESYTADGQLMRHDSEMGSLGNQGFVVTFENDAFGNWVEKRVNCGAPYAKKSAMKPCETTYRDITYYEDVAPRGAEKIDSDSLTYLLMGRGSMHSPQPLPFVPKP